MRILFAGTPEFAVPSLEYLIPETDIVGVLTAPDSRKGRGQHTGFSAVKQAALAHDLNVIQPDKLDKDVLDMIVSLEPQLLVCAAYGKIFRQSFLNLFPLGGINVHPSLLPLYRGPSPINAAILNGDSKTGVSVQRLALKMDTGGILSQMEYVLKGTETAPDLSPILAEMGGKLLPEVVKSIFAGKIEESVQDDKAATYCGLIEKHDGDLTWKEDAATIERMIRAYNPWPGVSVMYREKRLFFRRAEVYNMENSTVKMPPGTVEGVDKEHGILVHTIQGILAVQELQLEFKKALHWKEFMNGNKDIAGYKLGGY